MKIWAALLSEYKMAVLLVNHQATDEVEMTVHWYDIGLPAGTTAKARDLWQVRLSILRVPSGCMILTVCTLFVVCRSTRRRTLSSRTKWLSN